MQLVCPNCTSSYAVADNALGEHGRQVRCVRCKHVWFATPPVLKPAMEMAEEALSAAVSASPPRDEGPAPEPPPPEEHEVAAETAAAPHVDDAPPIAPERDGVAPSEPELPGAHDYFAARRRKVARKEAQKQRGWEIITPGRVAAAMIGIIVALLYGRESVARIFPQTVSLYSHLGLGINLRGLDLSDVKTSYETQDGVRVLVVEGEIRNVASAVKPVANLRFGLRNASGMEIYAWTGVPDRNQLAPGETQRFRSRLASPPSERHDLRVRFVQARDMTTAAKQ
ncbi:MAG TPA: MJ0042-type zinc finger domain-containing protein [Xanthobacteraceae bacterium]|nr:MJ0042-type zinc finger domain-containing protein [Xanthobacteraceae bacterium]